MKSFLVIFAIFVSLCVADTLLDNEDAAAGTTDAPTTAAPAPPPVPKPVVLNDTFNNNYTWTQQNAIQTYQIPTHIARGLYLSFTSLNGGVGTLYVSLTKDTPNADDFKYVLYAPSAMTSLSLSNANLTDAGADKNKNDTITYVTVISSSTKFNFNLMGKPLSDEATTAAPTTVAPTTTTTSSSTMLTPTFFNAFLLIFFYNFFTFSK